MDLLDFILLGMVGLAILKGYKKGFFVTLISLAGYVIGLVGTTLIYKPVLAFVNQTMELPRMISPWVTQTLSLPASSEPISGMVTDRAASMIGSLKLPTAFEKIMMGYVEDLAKLPVTQGIKTLSEGVAFAVSELIISAAVFSVLLVCLTAICRIILSGIFRKASPKLVTYLDALGGAALGLCGGVVSISALIIVLVPLVSLGAVKSGTGVLAEQVHNSFLVGFLMSRLEGLLSVVFSGSGI